ncbi:TonB-dependent receptor [Flavobacterium stagni]|uniref:TonB-dependent receptor n=1 Tax=Flavobacterium stagni TaxID=2506421 RepID=A0A4Q1K7G9_9FLAO|nr:TonB-dependent receptor [Flavobacterium stagni]RXR21492.1 TonB-dependent receptor [Flavobacterium stagni]
MKKLLIHAVIFLSLFVTMYGQTLKGTIVDAHTQLGIENVYVINTKNHLHFHTDNSGNFLLEKSSVGDQLNISKEGYIEKSITLTSLEPIIITLTPKGQLLDEVVIQKKLQSFNAIAEIDLKVNPVNSSQELLRKVPGLFIGQHAGGGKAEQLFLRGFDCDHGTDVAISVDGMPVNMVSQAHGQGYADLHFVIPETVQKIEFDKGPYFAEQGNFATAGYVAFQSKKQLTSNQISVEGGQFETSRILGLFSLIRSENENLYTAIDFQKTNGPFEHPQHFNRYNFFTKYSKTLSNHDTFDISASHFTSGWDASGQIPQRAVDMGLITRFGAIDAAEGGETSRSNLIGHYFKTISHATQFRTHFYLTHYAFDLFSNFTFFLNDPVNGDQIRQKENRTLLGFESRLDHQKEWGDWRIKMSTAVGYRQDLTKKSELAHTLNRHTTLQQMQYGDITETDQFAYFTSDFSYQKWLINPSVRVDYFDFQYQNFLLPNALTQSQQKVIVSPKLNILYQKNNNWNVFLKLGKGFHSNDTRVLLSQSPRKAVPAALGADFGTAFKPFTKLWVHTTFWYLHLDQEFVYVGDEGIVEPAGKTQRMGWDLGLRFQLNSRLYFSSDLTLTRAKLLETPASENRIPLAPVTTFVSQLTYTSASHWNGSIAVRYMGDRPADETNSIVAKGYCVTDMNVSYAFSKSLEIGTIIQNLFNTQWNETQFATTSRLQFETAPVTEIHFTPGTPFFGKIFVRYKF